MKSSFVAKSDQKPKMKNGMNKNWYEMAKNRNFVPANNNKKYAKLLALTLFSGKVVGGLMKCNIGKKTLSCHHLI